MIAQFVETAHPNVTGQKVAIAMIFIFVFFYGLFIDAASFIYSSEIYPTNIRSRGVAMATATYFIGCITYVTPGATAIATIGWRYFLVFVCLTAVTVMVVYFWYPETKGKSLEELAEVFGERVIVGLDSEVRAGEKEVGVEFVESLGQRE